MKFAVTCTADVSDGRVRCRRITADATRMIRDATQIWRRQRSRNRLESQYGKGFRIIAVSVYDSDLAALDLLVARLRQAGRRDMSRSKLLRIAFRQMLPMLAPQFTSESAESAK